jgi:hypothetical protein
MTLTPPPFLSLVAERRNGQYSVKLSNGQFFESQLDHLQQLAVE